MSINSVQVSGRLVRDPEVKVSQAGTQIFSNAIAVEDYDPNASREDQPVSFYDFAFFGNFAELLGRKLKKGDNIVLSGRLKQNRWKTPEGENRSRVEIIGRECVGEFMYRSASETGEPVAAGSEDTPAEAEAATPAEDEIPF